MKTLGGLVAVMLLVGVVGLVAAVNDNGWAGAEGSAHADGNAKVRGVFDAHIATAQRLQAAGAVNASDANAFVAAATDLKTQFAAASNGRARAEILVKLNTQWRAFAQTVNASAAENESLEAQGEINQSAREQLREKLKEGREDLREKIKDVREEAREKENELRQERQNVLFLTRAKVAVLEARLKELRAKAELSEDEKAEFKAKVLDHIEASFEERIKAAQRLDVESVNHTLVANFVAAAQADEAAFANATNNTVRKQIVSDFNAKWRAFKQAAQVDLKEIRLKQIVNQSEVALGRINALIDKLQARGYNVANLQNASATIAVRLQAAVSASTFQEGMGDLQAAHRGLVYLKQAIQLTIRREQVGVFEDRLDARIAEKLNASAAVASQTTVGVGGILSAAASILTGSPSPQPASSPTPSSAPSPSPSASATPAAQASASASANVNAGASGSAGVSGSANGSANAGGTAATGGAANGSLNSGGSALTSSGVSAGGNGNLGLGVGG